ncbi:MAG TPA: LysR family transcriptional regulator [Rhodocyclaceae bacterium]|nr:LysR family transcriptional regulator [Rhodocyclaceae bacterium]
MHFNRLDLNLLVALDTLLEELNITRAGERLSLSQSAMSGALARLRDYFQDELLVQVGRKMMPTALAENLRPRVRSILLEIQATVEARPSFDPATTSRHFRICASDYVVTVLFTQALARLSQTAPGLSFEFLPQTENVFEPLDRGEIDLLILPDAYTSDRHPHADLFQDDFVCVVWDQNSTVGNSLSLDHYLSLGHVTTRIGVTKRVPALDEWFANQHHYNRRLEAIAYDFNTAMQMVIGTQRVITTHRRLALHHARHLPLRLVPAPLPVPRLLERMQWHPYQDQDVGHRWLRDMLVQVAQETAVV